MLGTPWRASAKAGGERRRAGRPSAVHHVQGLTLVLPSGQLVRASRRRNAGLFALAAGGDGVIGALYSVTLDIASICAALDEAVGAEFSPRRAPPAHGARCASSAPALEVQKFLEDAQALCHEWRMELAGVRLRRTRIEEDTLLRWARRDAALSLTLAAPAALSARRCAPRSYRRADRRGDRARRQLRVLRSKRRPRRPKAVHRAFSPRNGASTHRAVRQQLVSPLPAALQRRAVAVRFGN